MDLKDAIQIALASVALVIATAIGWRTMHQGVDRTHQTEDRDRDRAYNDLVREHGDDFSQLVREKLLDDSRWRELLQAVAANMERRHTENLAAIEREAKAVDNLAAAVRSLEEWFKLTHD